MFRLLSLPTETTVCEQPARNQELNLRSVSPVTLSVDHHQTTGVLRHLWQPTRSRRPVAISPNRGAVAHDQCVECRVDVSESLAAGRHCVTFRRELHPRWFG